MKRSQVFTLLRPGDTYTFSVETIIQVSSSDANPTYSVRASAAPLLMPLPPAAAVATPTP